LIVRHESRVYSCYARFTGHNLTFCHQSPTGACVTGNGEVRSLWDNVASSLRWPPKREQRWRLPASRRSGARSEWYG
jgi:hypothetical protein